MEFDLQRFAPEELNYGNTTADGSRIEAYIHNPSIYTNGTEYDNIHTISCYTYQHNLGGRGNFMLYKTQHKWGGAYIVSKRIYQGAIYYSPFQLVGFYTIGNYTNYDGITEYEVDMSIVDTSLTVYLKPGWVHDEVKFNPVDNVLRLWVPEHDIEASPKVPNLKVIVNGEIVNDYNGISIDYNWRYIYFYNDNDDVKLTIDPDLVKDDYIVLQFLVHGDD